jgi:C1A family cysteine protease
MDNRPEDHGHDEKDEKGERFGAGEGAGPDMSQFIAEATNYNDQGDGGAQGDGGDGGSGGWTEDDFSAQPSDDFSWYSDARHVKVSGAILGKASRKEDRKTAGEVAAFHVDEERDAEVGVELSRYNLNYVFNKRETFKAPRFSETFLGDLEAAPLPAKVDWRSRVDVVYDQGTIGSCVANGTSAAVKVIYKRATGLNFNPSRLFIYYNGRVMHGLKANEDTGLSVTEGYRSVDKYSACDEALWKYDRKLFPLKPSPEAYAAANRLPTFQYAVLDNDINQLKRCLADGYFITFGAALFSSFMSAGTARTGNVTVPNPAKESRAGGHCMCIVGYDDARKVFIVLNSWSSRWGDKGFCYFPYQYMLNDDYCGDFCSARVFSK